MALYGLSGATFLACLFFPLLSSELIEPYVVSVYGQCASMSQGNVVIMIIMMVMILLFPLSFINYGRGVKVMDAYLGGANVQSSVRFLGAASQVHHVHLQNYYLRTVFNEGWLSRCGVLSGTLLLVLLLGSPFWRSSTLAGRKSGLFIAGPNTVHVVPPPTPSPARAAHSEMRIDKDL
jgi:ech hydrogenase subunit A